MARPPEVAFAFDSDMPPYMLFYCSALNIYNYELRPIGKRHPAGPIVGIGIGIAR